MTVKIKVSYEDDQEKDQVIQLLTPILKGAKIKAKSIKKPYKTVYITTNNHT